MPLSWTTTIKELLTALVKCWEEDLCHIRAGSEPASVANWVTNSCRKLHRGQPNSLRCRLCDCKKKWWKIMWKSSRRIERNKGQSKEKPDTPLIIAGSWNTRSHLFCADCSSFDERRDRESGSCYSSFNRLVPQSTVRDIVSVMELHRLAPGASPPNTRECASHWTPLSFNWA